MSAILPLIKGSQAEIMAVTADLDLTLSQGRILLELERAGETLALNNLASRISLSIAATGRAVDALYRSGLLTRREDDVDRRIKRIGPTARGHEIIAEITQIRQQSVERFVAGLSEDERAALEQAVATLATLTSARPPAWAWSCETAAPSQESAT